MTRISRAPSPRSRRRARSGRFQARVAEALVAAALLAAAVQPGLAQEAEQAPRGSGGLVYGVIIDRTNEEPVAGAEVRLRPVGGGEASVRTSDENGRFELPRRPTGAYTIRFQRLGYETATDSVRLAAGSDVRLSVELVPAALQMEAVVVQTVQRSPLAAAGFYRRREMGIGQFRTRAEIEAERPYRVSDLFRSMVGVQVVAGPQGRATRLRMRGGCRPDLYVDGVRAVTSDNIDEILQPQDVEALEVYQVGQTPARFAGRSCGIVAAWTRVPEAVPGERSFWKRLLAAGVFAALAIILTR